jgi:8-oxo-dGTP diphosphatase
MIKVVAAYIASNEKVFITQRARGALAGKWEFPGGKVEQHEDLFTAIKREIYEELNLNVQPKKIIKSFVHRYDFGEIHLTLIECNIIVSPVIVSDGSHTNHQWSVINETKLEFAAIDKKILHYLRENKF